MQKERGFVALISVIIISAILLVLVYTLGASSFFTGFDALDAENKRVSLGLAEACVNDAMLQIAQGNDISTELSPAIMVDSVGPKTCRICEAKADTGQILTRAVYKGAYTNLSVAVDPSSPTLTITAWSETPTYSGPACILP